MTPKDLCPLELTLSYQLNLWSPDTKNASIVFLVGAFCNKVEVFLSDHRPLTKWSNFYRLFYAESSQKRPKGTYLSILRF